MTCANPKCYNMVKDRRYCSKTCGDTVRHKRAYDRKKRGILMIDCPECKGSGKLEMSMKIRAMQFGSSPDLV